MSSGLEILRHRCERLLALVSGVCTVHAMACMRCYLCALTPYLVEDTDGHEQGVGDGGVHGLGVARGLDAVDDDVTSLGVWVVKTRGPC